MKQFAYQSAQLEYQIWNSRNFVFTLWRKLRRQPTRVLYLHGINDPYQNHERILQRLTQVGFTVYALNFPGHGHSGNIEHISWEILVDIVNTFAREQRLHQTILLAYSMGGGVALKLLERRPDWIQKAVLIAPFCTALSFRDVTHIPGYLEEFMKYTHHPTAEEQAPLSGDKVYLLKHYAPLFINYDLDCRSINNAGCPMRVFINLEDKVILPAIIRDTLAPIAQANFVEMPEYSHDLYYISAEEIENYARQIIKYGT